MSPTKPFWFSLRLQSFCHCHARTLGIVPDAHICITAMVLPLLEVLFLGLLLSSLCFCLAEELVLGASRLDVQRGVTFLNAIGRRRRQFLDLATRTSAVVSEQIGPREAERRFARTTPVPP